MKVKFVDVDALVSGESRVPAPRLQTQPALVLVLPHSHILTSLTGSVLQPGRGLVVGLVQGSLLVLVLDGDQSSRINQILSDVKVSPETCVVKWSVAMLIHKVYICFLSQELKQNQYEKYVLSTDSYYHRLNHFSVAMSSSQVQRSVIPHVSGVNPGSTRYQHLQDLQVTSLGCPVKRGELMIITTIINDI